MLIDEPKLLFESLQENRLVEVYECLAIFSIFSGETFENKCLFIFRLFDFDTSDTLEKTELVKTLRVVIKSICKVVGLPIPLQQFFEDLSDGCFRLMDTDDSGKIDFYEFYKWIDSDFSLQDFLLKYTNTISYSNAKRRMDSFVQKYSDDFSKIYNNINFNNNNIDNIINNNNNLNTKLLGAN